VVEHLECPTAISRPSRPQGQELGSSSTGRAGGCLPPGCRFEPGLPSQLSKERAPVAGNCPAPYRAGRSSSVILGRGRKAAGSNPA